MEDVGTLRQEIQQTRPFASPGAEATLGLLRTTDLLRRHLGRVVEPRGLTLQQYNVLRILRGAGTEGLPTLMIAERMIEHTPGITRLLDRLEARGWVRRERSAEDRRQVRCFVTAAGKEVLSELDEPLLHADEAVIGRLSQDDCRQLILLLDKVRAGLG